MKNSVKHITVGFLIAIVLFSTMGLSVNTLYCFCTGKSETSLFDIAHQCEKEPSENALQLPEGFYNMHPCCQKAIKDALCKKTGHDNHDCTKKTKKHLKADLKFLEIKKSELPTIELLAIQPQHNTPLFSEVKIEAYCPITQALPRPPPPQYSGRDRLNFLQVYRC
ncbi:MAG: hypothetical protein JNL70_22040 [Saprospiraceae bacterium]|nr:hypothetical protein [Saprospiraceae bacterium]